jgi:hypothetical protein
MTESERMRFGVFFCALVFVLLCCGGCILPREQILYYDRNRDSIVDLKRHHYRGAADADWELRDDDFDGRFEKKVLFGVGIIRSSVDIPVPRRVRIQSKTPMYLLESGSAR